MSCCLPAASVVPLPPLADLLQQLEALSPADAERFRPQLAALEVKGAQVHAQLLEDEAALVAVEPSPLASAFQQWLPRSSAAYGSRYAWRGLAVDAGVLREALEFALFMARCAQVPEVRCEVCQGTSCTEALPPAWPAVARPGCVACTGAGRLPRR